jgi:hypothetical protein
LDQNSQNEDDESEKYQLECDPFDEDQLKEEEYKNYFEFSF